MLPHIIVTFCAVLIIGVVAVAAYATLAPLAPQQNLMSISVPLDAG